MKLPRSKLRGIQQLSNFVYTTEFVGYVVSNSFFLSWFFYSIALSQQLARIISYSLIAQQAAGKCPL
jgi:hypothetical protein